MGHFGQQWREMTVCNDLKSLSKFSINWVSERIISYILSAYILSLFRIIKTFKNIISQSFFVWLITIG